MSSDQMPAPRKTELTKFPPSRAGKDVKYPGYAGGGGDVKRSFFTELGSIWPEKKFLQIFSVLTTVTNPDKAKKWQPGLGDKKKPTLHCGSNHRQMKVILLSAYYFILFVGDENHVETRLLANCVHIFSTLIGQIIFKLTSYIVTRSVI